eukprot:GHVT01065348.1.p1 GENE.GHVT01065348.1~~GHVT01065348.1.p1  ORF type:complete len:116 (-),score=1.92 GHVT01065348.1:22-369(-)
MLVLDTSGAWPCASTVPRPLSTVRYLLRVGSGRCRGIIRFPRLRVGRCLPADGVHLVGRRGVTPRVHPSLFGWRKPIVQPSSSGVCLPVLFPQVYSARSDRTSRVLIGKVFATAV